MLTSLILGQSTHQWRVYLSKCLLFRHLHCMDGTTTNSGQRDDSECFHAFLAIPLDTARSRLREPLLKPPFGLLSTGFKLFCGWCSLRQERRFVSVKGLRPEKSLQKWRDRSREEILEARANWRTEARDSESSCEIHSEHRQRTFDHSLTVFHAYVLSSRTQRIRKTHHRVCVRTPS